MREFKKSKKLDKVSYDIRGPIMDEANRLRDEGVNILRLNLGNPGPFGYHAPEVVTKALSDNLLKTEGYSDSKGLKEAREAILEYCKFKGMHNVSLDDIYTGNGVSELIQLSMQALLDEGDEVLIPTPDYPLWTGSVFLAGGKAVHYICDEANEWNPDLKDMESKISDKTKAIVVINPNNPTGAVYSKEILEGIVALARKYDLILFADEIYDRLVFDGVEHIALASLAPDLLTVSYNGLSKSHFIAGYRCGWMVMCGDKSRAGDYIEGIKLLSSMRLCANVPAQSLIPIALKTNEETKAALAPGGRLYEQREYIYNALNAIEGVSAVKPKAAFYIFPRLDYDKFKIKDDEKFALDLLRQQHVLVTKGTGFNYIDNLHFRIVYLPCVDDLKVGMDKLTTFLKTYQQ